ncbi:uncharacterized protein LOC122672268 [Telopea speciosissima]|uniref:uncharacterized protein LOC122672268 n=1 Tax=Telopea speciosissima TaxID=54955 RepID=UPI001CC642AC|nr:uncharacterized protein LOC122672268 [Telopea speciosissima]
MYGYHVSTGAFAYHQYCDKPKITSVCLADDLFVFGRASKGNASELVHLLSAFSGQSGLAINRGKSSLFFANTPLDVQVYFEQSIGITTGSLPIRYLGVPLASKKLRSSDFLELVSKVQNRIDSWSTKSLSFAGRVALIQSVLMGTINYWLSVFRLPSSTILALEKMMARFLWKGYTDVGTYKVSWIAVCRPKEEGGLGLWRLRDLNTVALMRHVWTVAARKETCWSIFVRHKWLRHHSIWSLPTPTVCSSSFREILHTREVAFGCVRYLIKDGGGTLLWSDPWLLVGRLGGYGVLLAEALGRSVFDRVDRLLVDGCTWANPYLDPVISDRWDEVKNTKVHSLLHEDLAIWTPTANGLYSLRSAWAAVRGQGDKQSWVKKFSFTAAIYRLWQERNARIFLNQCNSAVSVLSRIVSDTRGAFSFLGKQCPDTMWSRQFFSLWGIDVCFVHPKASFHVWKPPPLDWVALNCDGSVIRERGGNGAIGRDHLGRPLFAVAGGSRDVSIIQIELQAIKAALLKARALNLTWVQVRSDSILTIQMIVGTYLISWKIRWLIEDIWWLRNSSLAVPFRIMFGRMMARERDM